MTAHVAIPTAGFYKMRRVKDGPWVAVRLWQGFGVDPDGGDDRGMWVWRAERGGKDVDVDDVWPWCAKTPIDEAEYRFLLARADYAVAHDHRMPDAKPTKPVDYSTMRFNF